MFKFATKMIGHFSFKNQNDRAFSWSKRATKMIEVENFFHQNDRLTTTRHTLIIITDVMYASLASFVQLN